MAAQKVVGTWIEVGQDLRRRLVLAQQNGGDNINQEIHIRTHEAHLEENVFLEMVDTLASEHPSGPGQGPDPDPDPDLGLNSGPDPDPGPDPGPGQGLDQCQD